MLKKISRLLLLGIVVCAGSAYVTPTYASSAILLPSPVKGVIITHIYPGTPQGATQELVAIFNNTDSLIDITGWCIKNATAKRIHCFDGQVATYWIEPGARVVIASEDYVSAQQSSLHDVSYVVANRNSGSLIGSGDSVLLLDELGRIADEYSWMSATQKGNGFIRNSFDREVGYYTEGATLVEQPIVAVDGGGLKVADRPPEDDILDPGSEGDDFAIKLSEILPNPSGSDVGAEFIEIYNPSDVAVQLSAYRLFITAGASKKSHYFPEGAVIGPGEYKAFSDKDMKYTLNNSSGSVVLIAVQGAALGDVELDEAAYENPADGMAWAWFHDDVDTEGSAVDGWTYTQTPTPGAQNRHSVASVSKVVTVVESKPCAVGQYRNQETGRCRKVETVVMPAACKQTQYRNPETGRCKNIASSGTPTPCKVGQERSAETGRCRAIKRMTDVDHAPAPKTVESRGGIAWYTWLAVAIIVAGVGAYGAWEWRSEIRTLWGRVTGRGSP